LAIDPFVELRTHLHAAINDAIAGLEFSHSQLLGQRVSSLNGPEAESAFLPALLCTYVAETLGASDDAALAAGTALALVEASAHVVDDIVIAGSGSDIEPRGLIGIWGVPRTLNAADGFFALAHDVLMRLDDEGEKGVDASRTLVLTDELNEACRAWSEESDARFSAGVFHTQQPSQALVNAAVRLGALVAGREASDFDSLMTLTGLQPSATSRLSEAADYLAGVPRI
jgi:hypothetical protein